MAKHVEYALISRLKNAATRAGDRVFPYRFPINASIPAIVVSKVTDQPSQAHSGPLGVSESLVQLTVFAKTDLDLRELESEATNALDGFSGTIDDVELFDVTKIDGGDLFEESIAELEEFASTIDFLITWVT